MIYWPWLFVPKGLQMIPGKFSYFENFNAQEYFSHGQITYYNNLDHVLLTGRTGGPQDKVGGVASRKDLKNRTYRVFAVTVRISPLHTVTESLILLSIYSRHRYHDRFLFLAHHQFWTIYVIRFQNENLICTLRLTIDTILSMIRIVTLNSGHEDINVTITMNLKISETLILSFDNNYYRLRRIV